MAACVIQRVLANSVCIANRAGRIIRDIWKTGDLAIIEKAPADLQTEADRSAHKCIVASLCRKFPRLSVFGEEDDCNVDMKSVNPDWIEGGEDESVLAAQFPSTLTEVVEDDIVVWVDPLDGTSEFTQGLLDHVTVLIGLAVNGKAVAGVIHQPYYNYQQGMDANLGRTIWGVVGVGTSAFPRQPPPPDKLYITTTRSHSNQLINDCIDAMRPTDVLRVGGAGHKVLLLIEGRAHGYVFPSAGCKKWDTCAPEAVLRAVGGSLTDIHGRAIPYQAGVPHMNGSGVLASATGPAQHQWYVDRVPQWVRQQLHPDTDTDAPTTDTTTTDTAPQH